MHHYYMLNKPHGYISARRDERHRTVLDLFPEQMRDVIYPVGRLDLDTEGLLILTDDGDLCYRITNPAFCITKKYFFWVHGEPDVKKLSELALGARVFTGKDIVTAPAKIELLETRTLRDIKDLLSACDSGVANRRGDTLVRSGTIEITEGKKHQVKRMMRFTGPKVVYLKRLAIADLSLDPDLLPGEYRELTPDEIAALKKITEKSEQA